MVRLEGALCCCDKQLAPRQELLQDEEKQGEKIQGVV